MVIRVHTLKTPMYTYIYGQWTVRLGNMVSRTHTINTLMYTHLHTLQCEVREHGKHGKQPCTHICIDLHTEQTCRAHISAQIYTHKHTSLYIYVGPTNMYTRDQTGWPNE